MRQNIDRIFVYDTIGTVYREIATPRDLVAHAISEYMNGRLGAVRPRKPDEALLNSHIPIGQSSATADQVTEILGDLAEKLRDTRAIVAMNKLLFAGGSSDYVWKERSFLVTLDELFTGAATKRLGSLPEVASLTPVERVAMSKILLAMWVAVGVVQWRDDMYEAYDYPTPAIAYAEMRRVVAESKIRQVTLPTFVRTASSRVAFGAVHKYCEEATKEIARQLTAAASLAWFTGKISETVAEHLRVADPALPRAPFEPLLSSANFVERKAAHQRTNPMEVAVLTGYVSEVLTAVRACPNVVELSTNEFLARYDVKRIYAARGTTSVATVITRRVAESTTPTAIFDKTEMSAIGAVRIEPASTIMAVGTYDQTAAALNKVFDQSLIDEVYAMFAEADARRMLLSTLEAEELAAVAVCASGAVDYFSPSVDPLVENAVSFIVDIDPKQSGWEDLATTIIDGRALVLDWRNVLRVMQPREATVGYKVSDGVVAIANRAGGATVFKTGAPPEWIDAGKPQTMGVTGVQYEFDPMHGMKVKGKVPGTAEVTLLKLLGMAPFKSHIVSVSSAARMALYDRALMFCALKEMIDNPSTKATGLFMSYTAEPLPLYSNDEHGKVKQGIAQAQTDLMYIDALVRFLTSTPVRIAHAEAIARAGLKAHTPTETLERQAYFDTVIQYLEKFIAGPAFGTPDEFKTITARLSSRDMFVRHALYMLSSASFAAGGTR
jgi:hypothetical protein